MAGSLMQDGNRKDSRIPKDLIFYDDLEKGTRKTGSPLLHFKDVCKRDIKSAAFDIESWELMVEDHLHMAASCNRGNQACR